MRVSEYFQLDRTQSELDFVDVHIDADLPVFVDPRALRTFSSEWASVCVSLLRDFFDVVLDAIRTDTGDLARARMLLGHLTEPNETRLGLSTGHPRGRGLGPIKAGAVARALSESMAVSTGLLRDLEDTILLVDGIRSDLISDITTNVIREPLLLYTQLMCRTYGIELTNDLDVGAMWDQDKHEWHRRYVEAPFADDRPLLLVPKAIVRRTMDYDAEEYYRYFLLERFSQEEENANSALVHVLKDGRKRVYIKDLRDKYGEGKRAIVRLTRQHPEILDEYRANKRDYARPALDHSGLAEAAGLPEPRWSDLLDSVISLRTGRNAASAYERAVEKLLTALFYPYLTNPVPQQQIHAGRKRIDITYTNIAGDGFFRWLTLNWPTPYIHFECKNYREDPANPELDQLAGRFSPRRGRFGILVARTIADKSRFAQRCRDTADDGRGFIIGLDDGDLAALVEARRDASNLNPFDMLEERFGHLVM